MQTGSLGDVVFETSSDRILTPNAFSWERSAKYASNDLVGAKPCLEYVAPELSGGTLSIQLREDFGVNPVQAAGRLSQMCHDGEVLRLIIGGQNLGNVVIEKVSQQWKYADGQAPRVIVLSLTLKEYV